MSACEARCKPTPLPPSFPLERARDHPGYRHVFDPGAPCELGAGHDGPHRSGGLIWHDPPLLLLDGEPYQPSTEPWRLFGEEVDRGGSS